MQTYADHVAHEMAHDCSGFPHEIHVPRTLHGAAPLLLRYV